MKAAELCGHSLESEGVEYLFALPAEENGVSLTSTSAISFW